MLDFMGPKAFYHTQINLIVRNITHSLYNIVNEKSFSEMLSFPTRLRGSTEHR